jgi:hypothetical protein
MPRAERAEIGEAGEKRLGFLLRDDVPGKQHTA